MQTLWRGDIIVPPLLRFFGRTSGDPGLNRSQERLHSTVDLAMEKNCSDMRVAAYQSGATLSRE